MIPITGIYSRGFIIAGLVSALTACGSNPREPHIVKSQQEVGTVAVAVTLVAPFEEYADLLTPDFKFDAETALNKVIARTGAFESKLVERLSSGVNVNVQTLAATAAPTKSDGGSKDKQKTPDSTKERESGTASSPSGKKQTDGASGNATGETKPGTVADPMLQYTAATALYQEVQLLKRLVADAAMGRNRRSYVVRLQVDVVPFARNQPYDVYTFISFFAESDPFGASPNQRAEVIPLLVTDSLEGALESQSLELARQYNLGLGGAAPTLSGNVKASKDRDETENWRGTVLNSLLTVGRFNDNTIQVRLGAARQGNIHAMVPQNHNITLVVTVPAGFVEDSLQLGYTPSVRVVSKTVMRNAETGEALPHQSIDDRITNVTSLLKPHFRNGVVPVVPNGFCPMPKDNAACTDNERERNVADYLLRQVYLNNYKEFDQALFEAGWRNNLRFERDLWSEIVETLGRSEFSSARFQLPFDLPAELPEVQALLVTDNPAKDEMTVVISGGVSLSTENMSAELIIQTKDGGSLRIPAQKISTSRGRDPTLKFASLGALKVKDLDFDNGKLDRCWLNLGHNALERWRSGRVPVKRRFESLYYYRVRSSEPPHPPQKPDDTSQSRKEPIGGGER